MSNTDATRVWVFKGRDAVHPGGKVLVDVIVVVVIEEVVVVVVVVFVIIMEWL